MNLINFDDEENEEFNYILNTVSFFIFDKLDYVCEEIAYEIDNFIEIIENYIKDNVL